MTSLESSVDNTAGTAAADAGATSFGTVAGIPMTAGSETADADARTATDDSAAGLVSGRRSDGTMADAETIARDETPGLGRMVVDPTSGETRPERPSDAPTRRNPTKELADQIAARENSRNK